jgi:competence protein ComEC
MLAYLRKNSHPGAIIDALVLTHPHDDHYPGASGLVKQFEVCDYYDAGFPKEGPKYAKFLAAVRGGSCNDRPTTVHMGLAEFGALDWGSELRAEVLHAWPGSAAGLGSGNTVENNASIVLKITYGSQSFLFMGDAEGKDRADSPDTPRYAESALLNGPNAGKLKSTVLKLAHHGSETSSSLPFVSAVDPRIILVSSGRKSFGGTFLPDTTTLGRYCAHNPAIRIYRTDQDDEAEGRTTANDADQDDVVLRTNGKVIQVQALSNGVPIEPTACVP